MSVLPWDRLRGSSQGPHRGSAPGTTEPALSSDAMASLTRRFMAYRQGEWDGTPHSLEETAAHFGVDLVFASRIDAYLKARLRLSSAGRAGARACRAAARHSQRWPSMRIAVR